MNASTFPVLPLAAAFAVGLGATSMPGRWWPVPAAAPLLITSALALAAGSAAMAARLHRVAALAVLTATALLGALRGIPHPLPAAHIARQALDVPVRLEGRLAEEPVRWPPDRARLLLDVESMAREGERRAVEGLVQLTAYGELPPLGEGQRIAVEARPHRPIGFRNPGAFDYPALLARRGIFAVGSIRAERVLTLGPDEPSWSVRVRRWAIAALGAHLPPPSAALLAGLLLGERSELAPAMDEAFRRAGVFHILAVSGFNVALVASSVFFVMSAIGLPRRAGAVGAAVAVLGFALVVGPQPSVVRATVMGLTVLGASLLERESQLVNALALAGLALLAWRPGDLWDPGFQLSFAATAGIVWLTSTATEALQVRGAPAFLASALAVSICAQAAVTPIMASHFNQLSLVGPLANLAVVPLAGAATILGLAALLAAALSAAAADVLFHALWPVLLALRGAVWGAAAVPAAMVALPAPPILAIACWFAGLALCPLGRRAARAAVALLLASVGLAAWPWIAPRDGLLRAAFLDVGQGDAIFMEMPEGQRLLVDGGPGGPLRFDVGRYVLAPYLWNLPARRLDLVAMSHSDPDHSGGLRAVLREFPVGEFWDNGRWSAGGEPTRLALEAAGVRRHRPVPGDRHWFGDAVVTVLHPAPDWAGSDNDQSVVLRVDWGRVSLLLTGDLGQRGEAALLAGALPLRATILKVGHHGSRFSSSEAFLDAVRPAIAVISVGARNPFRHPAAEALDRLAAAGARVYRTDRDGAVLVESDGAALRVTREATGVREEFSLDARGELLEEPPLTREPLDLPAPVGIP